MCSVFSAVTSLTVLVVLSLSFIALWLCGGSILSFSTLVLLENEAKLTEVWAGNNDTLAWSGFGLALGAFVLLFISLILYLVFYRMSLLGQRSWRKSIRIATIILWILATGCSIAALSLYASLQATAVDASLDEHYYFIQSAVNGTLMALMIIVVIAAAVSMCMCMDYKEEEKPPVTMLASSRRRTRSGVEYQKKL